ncbi:MAG: nitroreductase [Pedobacter sp.]
MNRKKFLGLAGSSIVLAGTTYYMLSDKSNFVRADISEEETFKVSLTKDERRILYLASLAPSGHNTQPWFIRHIEPLHWIVCNDKSRWLAAVDPTQRETILSIGAFIQNVEYAASSLGYNCEFNTLARTNQDEQVVSVKFIKSASLFKFDSESIIQRRTVRSNILSLKLETKDIRLLINNEPDLVHFIPLKTKSYDYLNEQTVEANRAQSYRDQAQRELANWIRFSSKDAEKHRDDLSTASMEIEGFSGWVVRNFYRKSNVMNNSFREQSILQVEKQVASSAGWFIIVSKDSSLDSLLATGMRMQRLFLKVKEKGIAIHPMTQILEEPFTDKRLNSSIGIKEPVQFILRSGYVKDYPKPVSLRRPITQLIKS